MCTDEHPFIYTQSYWFHIYKVSVTDHLWSWVYLYLCVWAVGEFPLTKVILKLNQSWTWHNDYMLEYVYNVYLQNVLNRYVWPDIILTTTTNISISCLVSTKLKSEKRSFLDVHCMYYPKDLYICLFMVFPNNTM